MKNVQTERKNSIKIRYSNKKTFEENPKECRNCSEGEYTSMLMAYDNKNFLEKFEKDFTHKCNSNHPNGCFNRKGFSVSEDYIFSVILYLQRLEIYFQT